MVSLSTAAPPSHLSWTRVHDLPDPVGFKGMIAGVNGDQIVIAGGSNFPVPRIAGGKKTFHRTAWMQPVASGGRAAWTPLGDVLPRPLAEGASVTTPYGIVSLGGDSGSGMVSDVLLLVWNRERRALDLRALPALPLAVGSAAAAWHDGQLYVTGGDDGRGGTTLCASLDLAAALRDPTATRWQSLPAWPGSRRFGAVLVPVDFGDRTELVLVGGKIGTPGAATQRDYLADAFAFAPATKTWRALPDLPRRALLAVAFASAPGRLVVAGGSDGHDLDRMVELGANYRLPSDAMSFDAADRSWFATTAIPLGVAGASVIPLPGGAHLIVGGEYSPALRTRQVLFVQEGAQ